MQKPKSKNNMLEMPQRKSPATSRTSRQNKTDGSETDSSANSTRNSPKLPERRSPRSPVTEKKQPGRMTELEARLTHLEEELKRSKDQLSVSDSCKMRAQQEADEAKQQLLAMAGKLQDSQHQLLELSAAEEARLHELRKISQERDKAWESELDAIQKQHAVDSAALASAMNEIQRLKLQHERVTESESSLSNQAQKAYEELQSLRQGMAETLTLVENLKTQLQECTESEAQTKAMLHETSLKHESAKTTIAMLHSEGKKAKELLYSATYELEESRAAVSSLEEAVGKLQNDMVNSRVCSDSEDVKDLSLEIRESDQLKLDISSLQSEIDQLRSALEAAEVRCHEEQSLSTIQIQPARELERKNHELNLREAELDAEVKETRAKVDELKADLMDKETELQSICAENEVLNLEIKRYQLSEMEPGLEIELAKARELVSDLKADLMDKETELQSISEENELLKAEMEKARKGEHDIVKGRAGVAVAEVEAGRASDQEAFLKLGSATHEAVRTATQLEDALAVSMQMEGELKRLRVQADQWRKAAEAAAAIVSAGGNNDKFGRSGSLDSEYHRISSKILTSPHSEDADGDDSPKRKNNVLKKLGGLWKKGQK